jgi:UDP-N-acetylglucosamine 2-epimerase
MNAVAAVTEMTDIFLTVWPKKHPVVYTNVIATKDKKCTWARFTAKHFAGRQITMADDQGCKHFDNYGMITVQIFTPIGGGQVEGLQLAQKVLNAYRGTSSSVMFTNHGIRDVGADGLFYQTNVNIDFNYSTRGEQDG